MTLSFLSSRNPVLPRALRAVAGCWLLALAGALGPELALAQLVASPPAVASVPLRADWAVRLQADGKGSDARGGQLLALLGSLGGTQGVATAQDVVSWPADGHGPYRIDSTLTPRGGLALLLRRLQWTRSAQGRVQNGAPELLQASNQKGDGPQTLVQVERQRLITREAGQSGTDAASSQPLPAGLIDPLTLTWGYLQRPLPNRPFTAALLINAKVQTAHIVPEHVTLAWQGKDVACTLLDAQSDQSSATLRIWLRQSDGLPLQVELGMGDRYGLDVVQTLAAVPAGLQAITPRTRD